MDHCDRYTGCAHYTHFIDDVVFAIAAQISAGSPYKAFCLVSKQFYRQSAAAHPDARLKFANHLVTLLIVHE